jgi:NADPH:quinone reductase-like Zn-dependent oxidoreductase
VRAFAYASYGGPGSIHELPDPTAETGQVRVRVRAASLNPFDNFVVQGYMKDRMPTQLPLIPCADLSGIVDTVGAGVEDFKVGDEVFGITGRMIGQGTLAELTVASSTTIAIRPSAIQDTEAAAMPLAGVSALMSVEAAGVKPKDVVVVIGASGGIGGYMVQLAAFRGAHVVAVTSQGHEEYVRKLGATEVIDRSAGDVLGELKSRHAGGVAAIIDTISDAGGLALLSQAVRKGGIVTSMRGAASAEELGKRDIKAVNIGTQVTTARLRELAQLRTEGKLQRPKIHTFTLDQAGDAFTAIGQSGGGKLVVTI